MPNEIMLVTTNLPSGYHRDLQLLKENLFPSFKILTECINMAALMITNVTIRKNILSDDMYKFAFSVEEVNRLVLQGMSFRDAYKTIGLSISSDQFIHSPDIQHSHEGSIGNLQNKEIKHAMLEVVKGFNFKKG